MAQRLTHLDEQGRATMVDVGDKKATTPFGDRTGQRHDGGIDVGCYP